MTQILVVDDNAIGRRIATKVLQHAGYAVDTANNGNEAVHACTNQCYDVVLMDCDMWKMDGYEATQQIRQLNKRQPIIIAVTALPLHEARAQCMDNLTNVYLAKPYSAPQLLKIISEKLTARSEHHTPESAKAVAVSHSSSSS